jgi:hypothetical protein
MVRDLKSLQCSWRLKLFMGFELERIILAQGSSDQSWTKQIVLENFQIQGANDRQ